MAQQKQRIITRTIYSGALQTVRQLGLKHVLLNYTTLNQALNEPTINPLLPSPPTRGMEIYDPYDPDTDTPNLYSRYLVMGNGGHKNIQDPNDSIPYTVPVAHMATDAGLFSIMPLIARPIDDALTSAERKKYGLRRTGVGADGKLYEFYFALKLEYDRTTPEMTLTEVVNGETVTTEFVPTLDNLRPTQSGENVTYAGKYANVSSFTQVTWDQQMLEEIGEACRLFFGNARKAIASELALCYGVEKPIKQRYPASGAQTPISVANGLFTEIAAMQVAVHATTYIPLAYIDEEYTLSLDLGASEPLIGVPAS